MLRVGVVVILFFVAGCLADSYNPDKYEDCKYPQDCDSSCVTIFQSRNYGGHKQCVSDIKADDCINLADWWQVGGGRLSSIDTKGTCVRLYDELDCKGSTYKASSVSSTNHPYLNNVGWEDVVKSVGSCDTTPNYKCTVKELFGSKIEEDKFAAQSEYVFQSVAKATLSSVGGFFPWINVGVNILDALETIKTGGDPYVALIDAKVEEGIAQNAAAQIKAKTGVIENWVRTITQTTANDTDRKIELLIALHTCEEVFLLFKDSNYAFSSNKVLSSPYLVAFSNIYYGLASMLYEFRADLRTKLKQDMAELAKLNLGYLKDTIVQRTSQFVARKIGGGCGAYSSAHGLPCSVIVFDKLISKEYHLCELISDDYDGFPDGCSERDDLELYQRCAGDIMENVEIKLNRFFNPTIDRLLAFDNKKL